MFEQNRSSVGTKNFIKIDIEGHESEIVQDIANIALCVPRATVFLSLHLPFWHDVERTTNSLRRLYEVFDVRDVCNDGIPFEALAARCRWRGMNSPVWGTAAGNFFEIVLSTHSRSE